MLRFLSWVECLPLQILVLSLNAALKNDWLFAAAVKASGMSHRTRIKLSQKQKRRGWRVGLKSGYPYAYYLERADRTKAP